MQGLAPLAPEGAAGQRETIHKSTFAFEKVDFMVPSGNETIGVFLLQSEPCGVTAFLWGVKAREEFARDIYLNGKSHKSLNIVNKHKCSDFSE